MAMQRVTYLDGWRGLAILFVLLDHFGDIERFHFGNFGVELFFVLSGRLMAELLVVQATPWRTFLWRRFSRIYPGLLAFCLLMLIVSNLRPLYPAYAPSISIREFLAGILFVMNYAAPRYPDILTIDHIWSVCVEEHAYLILVLIALAARRWAAPRSEPEGASLDPDAGTLPSKAGAERLFPIIAVCLAAAMMVSGIVQALFTQQNEHELFWRTDVRAASVLLPFAVYLTVRPLDRLRRGAALPPWLATTTFLLALILSDQMFPAWMQYTLGTIALAISVSTIDFAAPSLLRALRSPWLTAFGLLSYSLYLWQQPFYKFSNIIGTGPAMAGTALAATASYALVEKPCRSALNRLWRQRMRKHGVGCHKSRR
ncbi:MAG TPA: acyltransferase [Ensifer sp.]|nr:acyltransferase [Ensifer sp.]